MTLDLKKEDSSFTTDVSIVISVWVWYFLGSIISLVSLLLILNFEINEFNAGLNYLLENTYLLSYVEIIAVGGFPLLISLIKKEDFRKYGFNKDNLLKSIGFSLFIPMGAILISFALEGEWVNVQSFELELPLNIFYALIGFLAYGPLEVFFVIWLVVNTDKIFEAEHKLLSIGLIVTVVLFGFSHLITSPGTGMMNAFKVTVEFLVFGLIFKKTNNIIGPMIGWSLANGQVLTLVAGSLL